MTNSNELLRNYRITRRSFMLIAGKFGLFSLLASRMAYMQLIKANQYKTLANNNRMSLVMLPPARGELYDCNDNLIATNRSAFKLMLDKRENAKYREILPKLFAILELDEEEQERINKLALNASRRLPAVLKENLSWQQISRIEEDITELSGLYIEIGQYRQYAITNIIAHPIGYIGIANEKEKKLYQLTNVSSAQIGKSGIEKYYEQELAGQYGIQQTEVNARGQIVRAISETPAISGNNLKLNLDSDLQSYAMDLLNKRGSSAILMDVTNGAVLVMASAPSFDPNQFVGGISHHNWQQLMTNEGKPLVNKTIQNCYPPGSIFKMVVVLAALVAGVSPEMRVNCTGGSVTGGKNLRCWYRPGHGSLDMFQGIEHSCNSYMYQLARIIGGDKIAAMARICGFGVPTNVDLANEAAGLIPDSVWKREVLNQEWRLGDSYNSAIGQGYVLSTPLQLVRFAAMIATRGKLFTPRLVGMVPATQVEIADKHWHFLQESMVHVINSPYGTAYRARIIEPEWKIAGKTGTSQVRARGEQDLSSLSVPWESRNHGLFMAYGPVTSPRYALTVVVDHGGGGASSAAPIVRDIMRAAFKKYL